MSAEDVAGTMIPLTWLAMLGVEALGTGRACCRITGVVFTPTTMPTFRFETC